MNSVAILIPWFGRNLKGGAELHAWHLAAGLAAKGHKVEVLTTCCRSHADDWETNFYEAGRTTEPEHFVVHRFPVDRRNKMGFDSVNDQLLRLDRSALHPGVAPIGQDEETIFVNELIRSAALSHHLTKNHGDYDAVIFLPYLYGPVINGVHLVADKALLQPCLHDEAYAYLPSVARTIYAAKALLFLSEGESQLAVRLYGPGVIPKSIFAGAGVEIEMEEPEDISVLSEVGGERYILCLGRKDPGKKTDFIAQCFAAYKSQNRQSGLRLVIAGPGNIDLPANCPGLVDLPAVTDAQKRALLRNASALFHPSDNESYSRVIMEAWMYGRPVAASKKCLATAAAVSHGGGWLASDRSEWVSLFGVVENSKAEELDALGRIGNRYASEYGSWVTAISRYESAIDAIKHSRVNRDAPPARAHGPAIHQILPNIAFGDAISNHAIWIKSALTASGYESAIFALDIDPKASGDAVRFRQELLHSHDAILYHHSIGSEVTPVVLAHPGPKCLIYHNITPEHFLAPYLPLHAKLCREGRRDLPLLAPSFEVSVGDSNFNAIELSEAGFKNPGVLPICVDPGKWQIVPDPEIMSRLQDGRTNILFVGRLSPNKKQEDLIFAFSKYLALEPGARLILVGSPVTANDLYLACLEQLCVELRIEKSVEFTGHVTDSQLLAYYRTAHLFWSMSEHEGFCVPLIEAMWFDIPVLAYGAAAVPETLGYSGSIFSSKRDASSTANQAHKMVHDEVLRRSIIVAQQARRSTFLADSTVNTLNELVSAIFEEKKDPVDSGQSHFKAEGIGRIAVVKLDHIGDLLLASPVFTSLRRRFPDARITAVVAPGSAEVLRNHPDVDDCITFDAPWFWRQIPSGEPLKKALSRNSAALGSLTAGTFDLVVNLRSDLSNLLFAALLPHKHLLSYTNNSSFAFLASHAVTRTRGMHICDQHRDLLAQIGATEWFTPRMYPKEVDYVASRFLDERREIVVAIFAGAGIPLKCWAEAKFKELARRLCERKMSVVIVGSKDDFPIGQSVAEYSGAKNLCGKLTLLELSAFLGRCRVLVTNDSAPMHIGAAAGTPIVYITRPNAAEEFAPVGRAHLKCCAAFCQNPCEGFDADKRGELSNFCQCIQGISVDEVEEKVVTIIGRDTLIQGHNGTLALAK